MVRSEAKCGEYRKRGEETIEGAHSRVHKRWASSRRAIKLANRAGVPGAAIGGKAMLKVSDFRAQDKALRVDDTREGGLDRLAQGLVLTREIEQRDGLDADFGCHPFILMRGVRYFE